MKFEKQVIDGHIHFTDWFDENGKTLIEALDDYQDRFGFKALNICATPFNYADVTNNIMGAFYKLHNPSAYTYAGVIYADFPVKHPVPEGMTPQEQYKELMEIGFDGIKLMEGKPNDQKLLGTKLDDEFYDELFRLAEADGTNIVCHIADPDTFWDINKAPEWAIRSGWFYGDGTHPTLEELYQQTFNVLKKHPKLNITFAHFFFLSEHPDVLEKLFDTYENVTIDLVPGSEMYGGINKRHAYYKEFFEKYSNRILYGTDCTFPVEPEYWDHLAQEVYNAVTSDKDIEIYTVECKGLNLSDTACDKILSENFISRCGGEPRKINIEALKRYINKYAHLIEDEKVKEFVLNYLEKIDC